MQFWHALMLTLTEFTEGSLGGLAVAPLHSKPPRTYQLLLFMAILTPFPHYSITIIGKNAI